ncbi:MAG: tetratricopeptide repeat protein [Phycisphaerales bacterium]|nr:tetratricopeptide repeat protein [Phycisphaerales bacterium]
MTSRLFAAALTSIVVTSTVVADSGRRDQRDTCPPPRTQHRDNGHRDYGRRDSGHRDFGHSRQPSRRHNSTLDFHIGDGFSFSIGSRSSRGYSRSYSHYDRWPGFRSHRSHYSTHSYGLPSYRHTSRIPRVIVERPVVREVIREVPVVREVPVYRAVPRDPYSQYRFGWNALAQGDLLRAREYFADQVMYRPDDPTPKAGLALARADAGQDDQADWAMRRAVRAGLKQARDRMPTYDLERTLSRLEIRYEERAYEYHDTWLMVAAVRYLKGDDDGAAFAADKAMEYDPHDEDARRIYTLARYNG